ncbi:hypothetical protein HN011_009880 [Eciton burchellii]|nr:hypothetical protein HN011_009880 [Eciton burchellii]
MGNIAIATRPSSFSENSFAIKRYRLSAAQARNAREDNERIKKTREDGFGMTDDDRPKKAETVQFSRARSRDRPSIRQNSRVRLFQSLQLETFYFPFPVQAEASDYRLKNKCRTSVRNVTLQDADRRFWFLLLSLLIGTQALRSRHFGFELSDVENLERESLRELARAKVFPVLARFQTPQRNSTRKRCPENLLYRSRSLPEIIGIVRPRSPIT